MGGFGVRLICCIGSIGGPRRRPTTGDERRRIQFGSPTPPLFGLYTAVYRKSAGKHRWAAGVAIMTETYKAAFVLFIDREPKCSLHYTNDVFVSSKPDHTTILYEYLFLLVCSLQILSTASQHGQSKSIRKRQRPHGRCVLCRSVDTNMMYQRTVFLLGQGVAFRDNFD